MPPPPLGRGGGTPYFENYWITLRTRKRKTQNSDHFSCSSSFHEIFQRSFHFQKFSYVTVLSSVMNAEQAYCVLNNCTCLVHLSRVKQQLSQLVQFVGILDAFLAKPSSHRLRALFAVKRGLTKIAEGCVTPKVMISAKTRLLIIIEPNLSFDS